MADLTVSAMTKPIKIIHRSEKRANRIYIIKQKEKISIIPSQNRLNIFHFF